MNRERSVMGKHTTARRASSVTEGPSLTSGIARRGKAGICQNEPGEARRGGQTTRCERQRKSVAAERRIKHAGRLFDCNDATRDVARSAVDTVHAGSG